MFFLYTNSEFDDIRVSVAEHEGYKFSDDGWIRVEHNNKPELIKLSIPINE